MRTILKREAGEWLAGIHLEVQAVLADLVSGSQQRQSGPKVRGGGKPEVGSSRGTRSQVPGQDQYQGSRGKVQIKLRSKSETRKQQWLWQLQKSHTVAWMLPGIPCEFI